MAGLGESRDWGGSGELPHLFGVAQLELAAVARPADTAATRPVLEQLQKELPQLNGTCRVQVGKHSGFPAPVHVVSTTQECRLPHLGGPRVQFFPTRDLGVRIPSSSSSSSGTSDSGSPRIRDPRVGLGDQGRHRGAPTSET